MSDKPSTAAASEKPSTAAATEKPSTSAASASTLATKPIKNGKLIVKKVLKKKKKFIMKDLRDPNARPRSASPPDYIQQIPRSRPQTYIAPQSSGPPLHRHYYEQINPNHIPFMSPELDYPVCVQYPRGPLGFGKDPKSFDRSNNRLCFPGRPLTHSDFKIGLQYGIYGSYSRFTSPYQRLNNIDELGTFTFLLNVNLSHNRLTSLHALSNFHKLRVIDVEWNKIRSASDIPAFPKLTGINLKKNLISSTEGFQSFTPNLLEYLSLNYNLLKEIDAITTATFPYLRQLEFRGNRVDSLGANFNIKNLEQIFMANNLITSLGPLQNCRKLRTIHARANRIKSLLDFPKNLPELEYVNLRGNWIERISHFAPVGTCPVKALILTNNYVARSEKYRVEVVALVPSLRRLDKERISDVEATKAMFLTQKRNKCRIPPVRDEVRLHAPPPSPPDISNDGVRQKEVFEYINSRDDLKLKVNIDSDDDESHELPVSDDEEAIEAVVSEEDDLEEDDDDEEDDEETDEKQDDVVANSNATAKRDYEKPMESFEVAVTEEVKPVVKTLLQQKLEEYRKTAMTITPYPKIQQEFKKVVPRTVTSSQPKENSQNPASTIHPTSLFFPTTPRFPFSTTSPTMSTTNNTSSTSPTLSKTNNTSSTYKTLQDVWRFPGPRKY